MALVLRALDEENRVYKFENETSPAVAGKIQKVGFLLDGKYLWEAAPIRGSRDLATTAFDELSEVVHGCHLVEAGVVSETFGGEF